MGRKLWTRLVRYSNIVVVVVGVVVVIDVVIIIIVVLVVIVVVVVVVNFVVYLAFDQLKNPFTPDSASTLASELIKRVFVC